MANEINPDEKPSATDNNHTELDLDPDIKDLQEDRDKSPLVEDTTVEEKPKQSAPKSRRWLLLIVSAITMSAGVVVGWRWWQFQQTHVTTENAQINGHISPISPKIPAMIETILVKDGDYVKIGDPLVILTDKDLGLKVQQAEANLNAAKAQLKSAIDTVALTANTNTTQVQQAESNLGAKQAGVGAEKANVNQSESGVMAAQAQLQQSKLGVMAAQAKVKQAELGVKSANAKVAQAQADVNKTQPDFLRYQTLYSQGAVSAQQRDVAEAAFKNSQANLDIATQGIGQAEAELKNAQAQLSQAQSQVMNNEAKVSQSQSQVNQSLAQVKKSLAEAEASKGQLAETQVSAQKVGVQQDQVKISQAQVDQAKVALALAQQQLEYTTIKAPVSGYVGQITAQIGQKVQAGQPLLSVVPLQNDQIYVEANFKETALKNLHVGETAEVEADAYPGEIFRATVAGISPATGANFALIPPDNATGNFNKVVQWVPIRLTFNSGVDPQHKLRAGLSVKVTVNTPSNKQ